MDDADVNLPRTNAVAGSKVTAAGRQILFYAPVGLLGGTFTCSCCGATGWQPDVLDHAPGCDYRSADAKTP